MTTSLDEHEPLRFEDEVLAIALEALKERQRPVERRRTNVRLNLALTVLSISIAIAIALPIVLPGGGNVGAEPAAAAALHRVAVRAANQSPEPAPGPGQYRYTRSEFAFTMTYVVGDGLTFMFRTPNIRESWIGPDGSGKILNTPGEITFPTDRDRATWLAAGAPALKKLVIDRDSEFDDLDPGTLSDRDYSNLPTDPEELLELIERRELIGGPSGDWETFMIVGDLLRETWTTPQVRAALYRVAAELPGVELVGRVVDNAGRPGVAVAYTNPGGDARSRFQLVFDPKTAELLAESEVLVVDSTVDVESGGPGAVYGGVGPAGTQTYSTTYLVSGIVDSTFERISPG